MRQRDRTDYIVIHCSATPPEMDIGVREIHEWHRARGWSGIGYHFVIRRDGTLEAGRKLGLVGAHIMGHNYDSVGICMVGGVTSEDEPDDNFTYEQWQMLFSVVSALVMRYTHAVVKGHRDFPGVTKACPCFDAPVWWLNQKEAYFDAILKPEPRG